MDGALLVGASLGYGVLSAIFPVANAEAYLLAVAATADPAAAVGSGVAVGFGQTVGKVALFVAARRGREAAVRSQPDGRAGRWLGWLRALFRPTEAEWREAERLGALAPHREPVRVPNARPTSSDPTAAASATGDAERRNVRQPTRPAEHTTGKAAPGTIPGADQRPKRRGPRRWRQVTGWLARWSEATLALLDRPVTAGPVILASAGLGFPPLIVAALAAGVRRMPLPLFTVCVLVGRVTRFVLLVLPVIYIRR